MNRSRQQSRSHTGRLKQYGVRALFALILAASLPAWWLRIVLDQFAAEHDAIEKLRAAGALVTVEPAKPQWFWKRLPKSVAPHAEWATHFEANDYQGPIAAREMVLLGRLSHLRRINLRNLPLCDEDLAACRSLMELDDLNIKNCRCLTSAAIHHFRNARQLRRLDLTATPIDDASLETLAIFEQLEDLDLSFTNVTDAGIAHIGGLSDLRRLVLPRGITSRGLRHIERLQSLGSLSIYLHAGDDADALLRISRLPRLRSLHFRGRLGDAGLRTIDGARSLKQLSIRGDRFAQVGTTRVWTNSIWNEDEDDRVYAHGFPTRFTSTTSVPSQVAPAPLPHRSSDASASAHAPHEHPSTLYKEQSNDPQNDQTKSTHTLPTPSGAGGGGSRAPPYP